MKTFTILTCLMVCTVATAQDTYQGGAPQQPVVYQPQPVQPMPVYAPAPYYTPYVYQPAPYYAAPAPVYPAPAYAYPPPYYYGPRFGIGFGHHGRRGFNGLYVGW